jgi:hypothetical protein
MTGAIREYVQFAIILSRLVELRSEKVIEQIVLSTWQGEIDKHEGLRSFLRVLGVAVVEKAPLENIPNGHNASYMVQVAAVHNALEVVPEDVFVLKTRTDNCLDSLNVIVDRVLSHPETDTKAENFGAYPAVFEHKLYFNIFRFWTPFFLDDRAFYGYVGDLRRLFATYRVSQRATAEILMFGGLFLQIDPVLGEGFKRIRQFEHKARADLMEYSKKSNNADFDLPKYFLRYLAHLCVVYRNNFFLANNNAEQVVAPFEFHRLFGTGSPKNGFINSSDGGIIRSMTVLDAILTGKLKKSDAYDKFLAEVEAVRNGVAALQDEANLLVELEGFCKNKLNNESAFLAANGNDKELNRDVKLPDSVAILLSGAPQEQMKELNHLFPKLGSSQRSFQENIADICEARRNKLRHNDILRDLLFSAIQGNSAKAELVCLNAVKDGIIPVEAIENHMGGGIYKRIRGGILLNLAKYRTCGRVTLNLTYCFLRVYGHRQPGDSAKVFESLVKLLKSDGFDSAEAIIDSERFSEQAARATNIVSLFVKFSLSAAVFSRLAIEAWHSLMQYDDGGGSREFWREAAKKFIAQKFFDSAALAVRDYGLSLGDVEYNEEFAIRLIKRKDIDSSSVFSYLLRATDTVAESGSTAERIVVYLCKNYGFESSENRAYAKALIGAVIAKNPELKCLPARLLIESVDPGPEAQMSDEEFAVICHLASKGLIDVDLDDCGMFATNATRIVWLECFKTFNAGDMNLEFAFMKGATELWFCRRSLREAPILKNVKCEVGWPYGERVTEMPCMAFVKLTTDRLYASIELNIAPCREAEEVVKALSGSFTTVDPNKTLHRLHVVNMSTVSGLSQAVTRVMKEASDVFEKIAECLPETKRNIQ